MIDAPKLAMSLEFGEIRGQGNLGLEGDVGIIEIGTHLLTFQRIVGVTIAALTVVAVVLFIVKIISGGIGILSAGEDRGKVAVAKNDITFGVLGLLVVVSALFVAGLVGAILGVDLLELASTIAKLGGTTL